MIFARKPNSPRKAAREWHPVSLTHMWKLGLDGLPEKQFGYARKRAVQRRLSEDGMKMCSWCNEARPIGEFSADRKMKDGKFSHCRRCVREAKHRLSKTLGGHLGILATDIKGRARGRDFGCDIDKDFLLELWRRQGGLCYYTGTPLAFGMQYRGRGMNKSAVNVDRVNNSIGYLRSNVVLCSARINMVKNGCNVHEVLAIANGIRRHYGWSQPCMN